MNKAVFLDRDGTINVEKDYLYRIEDFEFLPGVVESLRRLGEAGYLLIVITNQSGIARGYYTERDFHILNDWLLRTLEECGVSIAKVLYCPHHPEAKVADYRIDCDCRKPKLGMFMTAAEEFALDLDSCYAVGDKLRDCGICAVSGCRGFLIGSNENPEVIERVKSGNVRNVSYASSLEEAADRILCIGSDKFEKDR